MKHGRDICQAQVVQPVMGAKKALRREQRHLRVVGDATETAICRRVPADSIWAELSLDLGP
jgi:hypothetical protein